MRTNNLTLHLMLNQTIYRTQLLDLFIFIPFPCAKKNKNIPLGLIAVGNFLKANFFQKKSFVLKKKKSLHMTYMSFTEYDNRSAHFFFVYSHQYTCVLLYLTMEPSKANL